MLNQNFPNKSGVYIFYNKKEEALYIGKAKNLKKRTDYYFKNNLPKRLKKMVSEAINLKFYTTDTENEALLLEAKLIEEKQPIYNILYKSGKSVHYIAFSNHEFSKLEIVNEVNSDFETFGPFISYDEVNTIIKALQPFFKLRTCTDYYFKTKKRPCLKYYANVCSGPCVNLISKIDYALKKEQFKDIVCGKIKKTVSLWEKQIKEYVKNENFEEAAKKRDQILLLKKISAKQKVYFKNVKNLIVLLNHENYFYMQHVKNGVIIDVVLRQYEKKISHEEFLLNYFADEIDFKILQSEKDIENTTHKEIYNSAYLRFYNLLEKDLIKPKIEAALNISVEGIEIYDGSHYSGKNALCAMVYYDLKQHEFVKNKFRIWKINEKTFNDLAILENALESRKKHDLPSMILLDGGLTQLNLAKRILPDAKIFALTKDEKRKTGIFYDMNGKELILDQTLILFFEKLRSKAHEFAKGNSYKRYLKNFV